MGISDDVMIARPERERAGFARRWRSRSLTGGGPDGNEKLTAVNGAILIVPLAVIGFTIPQLRQFIWLHLFVGLLLIGPVLLKMASTGYDPWLLLHKVTFIVWVVFTSVHILGHLPAVARALGIGRRGEPQGLSAAGGATGRWIALSGALVGGLVLAVALIPSFASWTAHSVFLHHHHH
jgi:hypothetical protein